MTSTPKYFIVLYFILFFFIVLYFKVRAKIPSWDTKIVIIIHEVTTVFIYYTENFDISYIK